MKHGWIVTIAIGIFLAGNLNAAAAKEKLIGLNYKEREAKSYRLRPTFGIYVVKYEAGSKTYLVRIENEPAVGPNITTLEWLIEAIDNGTTVKDFKRRPGRIVGSFFKLKKTLWLLTEDELEERRAKQKR